jgi:hypothetical protein
VQLAICFAPKIFTRQSIQEQSANRPPDRLSFIPNLILLRPTTGKMLCISISGESVA